MRVGTARRLDRWIGVPLCFLATALRKATAPLRRGRPAPPRAVLFIGLAEMGSAVLADPALRKAQRAFDARLYFATFARNAPAVALLGTVPRENIYAIPDAGPLSLAAGAVGLLSWARARRIDAVVDLEPFTRFSALLAGLCGSARGAGFHQFLGHGLYRGDLFTHRVAYNPHQHIAKNFVALVNALVADNDEVPYAKSVVTDAEVAPRPLPVPEEAREAVRRAIAAAHPAYDPGRHRLVLLNTDSSDLVPLRRWPQERYAAVASMLLRRYDDVLVLLTGSAAERAAKEALCAAVGSERCVNFAGRTAVADLPALFSLAALLLTNDSGPAHIASLTGVPLFVLFGPETPRLYAPLGATAVFHAGLSCSPCVSAANQRRSPCTDNVCLGVISPEAVFEALRARLDANRRGR